MSVFKVVTNIVSSLIPGGSVAKSIIEGAGSLLLRKAADKLGLKDSQEKILEEAKKLAEQDVELQKALLDEEQKRRDFENQFYGAFAELTPAGKFWRAMTRPILTITVVGMFIIGVIIHYIFQIIGNVVFIIPAEILTLSKWIVLFWFSGRSVEKIISLFNGGQK